MTDQEPICCKCHTVFEAREGYYFVNGEVYCPFCYDLFRKDIHEQVFGIRTEKDGGEI